MSLTPFPVPWLEMMTSLSSLLGLEPCVPARASQPAQAAKVILKIGFHQKRASASAMLSRRGYVLNKSDHTADTLQHLRRTLTVRQPYDPTTAYGPPPKAFKHVCTSPDSMQPPSLATLN